MCCPMVLCVKDCNDDDGNDRNDDDDGIESGTDLAAMDSKMASRPDLVIPQLVKDSLVIVVGDLFII